MTISRETMNIVDVVAYLGSKGKRALALDLMGRIDNIYYCDEDGNMDTAYIRREVTAAADGDPMAFREMQCAVTTSLWP